MKDANCRHCGQHPMAHSSLRCFTDITAPIFKRTLSGKTYDMEFQGPVDPKEADELLGMAEDFKPHTHLLLEAARACRLWHIAEEKGLGTFEARMDLCSYSEYATKVALGLIPFDTEWQGVPCLVITRNPETQS